MHKNSTSHTLRECLEALTTNKLSPLDFQPDGSTAEKLISLVLTGLPRRLPLKLAGLFQETMSLLDCMDTSELNVVVLGGGTGLSSIVGGDSRRPDWGESPFTGLKEIFPSVKSIVCVTDDGGSTGELLKILPLIALGDLRHVLLSSIRRERLHALCGLDDRGAVKVAGQLHAIFNFRFISRPSSAESLLQATRVNLQDVPESILFFLRRLIDRFFIDKRLSPALAHPQCLGNLLLASAIFANINQEVTCADIAADHQLLNDATLKGLKTIASNIGAEELAVLPCTTTSAQLQMLYANGVLVSGEHKSSQARRGYPVDRAVVEFFNDPCLPVEVQQVIRNADIIIYAPGSLYTSIIPILQVPGIADLVRKNEKALKILVSNIWVQKGETDAARDAPERKFHVSDLIRAYSRNIPGGVENLFSYILTLGMREIPGSVLQSYALEDKEPIYLDRDRLREIGFEPVEAGIFSTEQLRRRHVIQHDPESLALTVRTLWCLKDFISPLQKIPSGLLKEQQKVLPLVNRDCLHPCMRYGAIQSWLENISISSAQDSAGEQRPIIEADRDILLGKIAEIIWHHPDIRPEHLQFAHALIFVDSDHWLRNQQWDNIFSFYDPDREAIIIRADQVDDPARFEMAFLVAIGQSLLGNYAREKSMQEIFVEGEKVGHVYRLILRDPGQCRCYFSHDELKNYLELTRMLRSAEHSLLYSRLVNGDEGFTPPGLLFGLFYAWYLDNRFASHIEYKMSIMRNAISDLIPEQIRIVGRREGLIHFFREKVFRHRISYSKM
ncbi:MAG: YvcK family protein, partial [Desulfobulbaceae bacterium]|nr:YvcK family protein [Desulfobulbaceae bacterium]